MILFQAWKNIGNEEKHDIERNLDCCGWESVGNTTETGCEAACAKEQNCNTCKDRLSDKVDYAFNSSGGVGLFFAFTEVKWVFFHVFF